MSENDYIAAVKEKNKKLFAASEIKLSPIELEKQLKAAFLAGYQSGKGSKSIFEQVFG